MKIKIEQSKGPALEFEGQELGRSSSRQPSSERWTTLIVYKSDSGRYVAVVKGETIHPDEHTRVRAVTYDKLEEIVATYRYSRLAKKLYKNIGLALTKKL